MSKIFTVLIILLIMTVEGCGYSSRSEKLGHIDSVNISPIGNETVEYGLEDDLANALKQEFSPWGEGTDSIFTGTVKEYEVIPISWDQNGMPEQYRILLRMSFVFEDLKRNLGESPGPEEGRFNDWSPEIFESKRREITAWIMELYQDSPEIGKN